MPPVPPPPFVFSTHPTRPSVPTPLLLSAASRHQVDGLLQFVPQFVFATVPIPIQRCQDLQTQKAEITASPPRAIHGSQWMTAHGTPDFCFVPMMLGCDQKKEV